jgi:hypothetical protein
LPRFGKKDDHDIDESIPIDASILKKAIEKGIDLLGISTVEAIIEDVAKQGIDLNGSSRYTLKQVEAAITGIFGDDAGPLLMKRIKSWLKNYSYNGFDR